MKTIYIVSIVLVIIVLGVFAWYFLFYQKSTKTLSPSSSAQTESWTKNKNILFENVTSSDTHKLDDGTFRMYFLKDGKIVYADSKDATVFGSPISTGVNEEPGKFNSNPAVLKVSDGNWIMVYEEQPMKNPGEEQQKPPGPESQRNLLLATSQDGKSFTKIGVAIDSSKDKDDNYFASVPDLIKTPDSRIRLYYVCGGESTCSAISTDGRTFTKEPGIRMGNKAVDPDVLYNNGRWVMYFSTLEGAGNKFYKATSVDGLKWTKSEIVLRPDSERGSIVDPDVVPIGPNKWRMFFGEMANGEGQMGGQAQINLFWADFEGNIYI